MSSNLEILLETSDFLIINKPAGLSVHNEGPTQSSVLEILGPKLHLAHRLDKETSGILMLAKSSAVAATLMTTLGSEASQKSYRAILRGNVQKSQKVIPLKWTWPISDKAEGRQLPQGKSGYRVAAETQVEVVSTNQYFSDIKATILTGRQHQIRKHAAIAKHPIVGDPRYNERAYNLKIFSLYHFERMLLHAEQLKFIYNGRSYSLLAPLPEEFRRLFL
jgi:23S rRNA-/tRNA-specific pseudouridylate synthase